MERFLIVIPPRNGGTPCEYPDGVLRWKLCDTEISCDKVAECADTSPEYVCDWFKENNQCDSYAMQIQCQMTCGFCEPEVFCSDIDPWWYEQLIDKGIAESDMERLCFWQDEFVYRDENLALIRTCVAHSTEAINTCDVTDLVCGDPNTGTYGWPGNQAYELQQALDRSLKIHPRCPSGCQDIGAWWEDWLLRRGFDSFVISRLCLTNGVFQYIQSDQTQISTCVFKDDDESLLCPTEVFCPGTDSGTLSAGWPGEQADALVAALSSSNQVHPQCPGPQTCISRTCAFIGCPISCSINHDHCICNDITCLMQSLSNFSIRSIDNWFANFYELRGLDTSAIDKLYIIDGETSQYAYQIDILSYMPMGIEFSYEFEKACDSDLYFCGGYSIVGYRGQQLEALRAALSESNRIHPSAPSCERPDGWTREFWRDRGLPDEFADNLCSRFGVYHHIEEWNLVSTCVKAANTNWQGDCDPTTVVCAGFSSGFRVSGWPGQVLDALLVALEQTSGSREHHQCPLPICT